MTTQYEIAHRKPTHAIYHVFGQGKKAKWTRIGAAWPHKDGEGFNLAAAVIPLRGRIVIRTITEKAPAEERDA